MTLKHIQQCKETADKFGLSCYYIPSTDISSGEPMYTDAVRFGGQLSSLQILTGKVVRADDREPFDLPITFQFSIQETGVGYYLYRDYDFRRFSSNPLKHSKSKLNAISQIMEIEVEVDNES